MISIYTLEGTRDNFNIHFTPRGAGCFIAVMGRKGAERPPHDPYQKWYQIILLCEYMMFTKFFGKIFIFEGARGQKSINLYYIDIMAERGGKFSPN